MAFTPGRGIAPAGVRILCAGPFPKAPALRPAMLPTVVTVVAAPPAIAPPPPPPSSVAANLTAFLSVMFDVAAYIRAGLRLLAAGVMPLSFLC